MSSTPAEFKFSSDRTSIGVHVLSPPHLPPDVSSVLKSAPEPILRSSYTATLQKLW